MPGWGKIANIDRDDYEEGSAHFTDSDDDSLMDADVKHEGPEETLLSSVRSSLEAEDGANPVFTVGGCIDAAAPSLIRWDSGKVAFPVTDTADAQKNFVQLLLDSAPIALGAGDDGFKSWQMAPASFCTNFNPYEHGIVDAAAQALASNNDQPGITGIKAELTSLVIQAGTGQFDGRPHLDLTQPDSYMGSLIVCLPHPHEGGRLSVRRPGREVSYDWASQKPVSIRWAAFRQDCTQEISEVVGGHRVTLNYSLSWVPYGPASAASYLPALSQTDSQLFVALKSLISKEEFLPQGGTIGFTCTSAYPHTSSASVKTLEQSLKGIDMLVYQTLKILATGAQVAAVLDDDGFQAWKQEHGLQSRGRRDMDLDMDDDDAQSDDGTGHLAGGTSLLRLELGETVLWDEYEADVQPDPDTITKEVGRPGSEEWRQEAVFERRKVVWLNHRPNFRDFRQFRELAVAFTTYENEEAGIDGYYSSTIIVAEVGTYADRRR